MTGANRSFGKTDRILERLLALHPRRIDLSLGRLERLLASLGNPEDRLPPVIHVAGTNGKGSTVAMIRRGLAATGARVHVYTSPHLVRFAERIVLAGRRIGEARLRSLLERCERANDGQPITFFEITTAAALLGFAESEAEYCILEVGLGGRLDATNVVRRPALTAITRIGMDHTEFLGGTLAEIAREKAGILKSGVPGIIGRQNPVALATVEAQARAAGVSLQRCDREWTCARAGRGLEYADAKGTLYLPRPALRGAHQLENAGVAIAALRCLPVDESACRAALRARRWPARLQRICRGSLVKRMPAGMELWLDGGHNADAGHALAAELRLWRQRRGGETVLIVGMLDSKDVEGFLAPLSDVAVGAHAVPIPGAASAVSPAQLCKNAQRVGLACSSSTSVHEALAIASRTRFAVRVLICGSLHLAGHVLENSE